MLEPLDLLRMLTKRKLFILVFLALAIWFTWSLLKPVSVESRFTALFSDLSVGVPKYQHLRSISQPLGALKGDFWTVDFVQSDVQLRELANGLGVSAESISSSTNSWFRANSKVNPKYPWMLQVQASAGSTPRTYNVHIEARRPYD